MLQENDNFINQNDELSRLKFEAIATLEETQALKRIIQPAIKKFVEEIEQQGAKPDKFYQAVIPPEMVEGMKNGKFKFMEANDGSLLPNIVDTKNKIVKKVRIEEMELSPQNLNSVNQLSDKLLNQKLDAISDQLGVIMELAIEINKQLKNNNYAKVIGAIQTINQSYLEKGRNTVFCKTFIHNIAKKKYTALRLKCFSDYFGFDSACLSRKLSPVKLKMCAW